MNSILRKVLGFWKPQEKRGDWPPTVSMKFWGLGPKAEFTAPNLANLTETVYILYLLFLGHLFDHLLLSVFQSVVTHVG